MTSIISMPCVPDSRRASCCITEPRSRRNAPRQLDAPLHPVPLARGAKAQGNHLPPSPNPRTSRRHHHSQTHFCSRFFIGEPVSRPSVPRGHSSPPITLSSYSTLHALIQSLRLPCHRNCTDLLCASQRSNVLPTNLCRPCESALSEL